MIHKELFQYKTYKIAIENIIIDDDLQHELLF